MGRATTGRLAGGGGGRDNNLAGHVARTLPHASFSGAIPASFLRRRIRWVGPSRPFRCVRACMRRGLVEANYRDAPGNLGPAWIGAKILANFG